MAADNSNNLPTLTKQESDDLMRRTMEKIESLPAWDDVEDRFMTTECWLKHDILAEAAAQGITEIWDQGEWLSPPSPLTGCGTVACFAGWTCLLYGAQPINFMYVELPDGTTHKVRDLAKHLLQLTEGQAHNLFNGMNDLNRLRATVDALLNDEELTRA